MISGSAASTSRLRPGRRAALRRIADTILAAALATRAGRMALAGETARILERPLPAVDDRARPSLDVFVALSQLITCRPRLDRASAQKMYPLFLEEPWGPKHIATAYEELVRLLAKAPGACSAPQLIAAGALPEGETWFCGHVLETWYLGIYYHERLKVRVLYEEALMWEAVRDFAGVPAVTGGVPGYWINPPEASRKTRK
jgi:D-sorbitol dehydrogenase-like protein